MPSRTVLCSSKIPKKQPSLNHIFVQFILFVSFLLNGILPAQENEICFQQIGLEDGLSQSIVESILQDRQSFMWFATEDGLNRYDGYKFTVFKNEPNNINSLSYNQIKTLREIKKESEIEFIHFSHQPGNDNSLSYNEVYAIYGDQFGYLWIGTNDGGLDRYDANNNKFNHYVNNPGDANSVSYDQIRSIFEDNSGVLWIGTRGGGLNKMVRHRNRKEPAYFEHYRHDPNNSNSISSNFIRYITEDRNGIL